MEFPMKCARWFLTFSLVFLAVGSRLLAETAAPPKMVTFDCPDGPMPYGWILYSDEDGDGEYDYYTKRHCNGVITYGCYPQPCNPDYHITVGPVGTASAALSYNACSGGGYEWTVVEYNAAN